MNGNKSDVDEQRRKFMQVRMATKLADGLIEAGHSAADILEDLKDLYLAVKSLHENLLIIQDAVEEVLAEGISFKLMLDLVRVVQEDGPCLLYTSPSPRDRQKSRMPSSA